MCTTARFFRTSTLPKLSMSQSPLREPNPELGTWQNEHLSLLADETPRVPGQIVRKKPFVAGPKAPRLPRLEGRKRRRLKKRDGRDTFGDRSVGSYGDGQRGDGFANRKDGGGVNQVRRGGGRGKGGRSVDAELCIDMTVMT